MLCETVRFTGSKLGRENIVGGGQFTCSMTVLFWVVDYGMWIKGSRVLYRSEHFFLLLSAFPTYSFKLNYHFLNHFSRLIALVFPLIINLSTISGIRCFRTYIGLRLPLVFFYLSWIGIPI